MDLNVLAEELTTIADVAKGMLRVISVVQNGNVEGEALTATQKSRIKQKGLDQWQTIKDSVVVIDTEMQEEP